MKILTIFLGFLSFVAISICVVLGLLLTRSSNEVLSLNDSIKSILLETDSSTEDSKSTEDKLPVNELTTSQHFIDTGLGIDVTYPSDWNYRLNTEISDDFADGAFKSIRTYGLELSKDDSLITFEGLFGAVGDFGVPYPSSTHETYVLDSETIRVKLIGSNTWRYVSKVSCEDAMDWDGVTEICGAGGFFPGFTSRGPSVVSFTSPSEDLLEEADAIVLSSRP